MDGLKLTKRQAAVLQFIRSCIERRGYGPTIREIGQEFGIRSPNGVVGHLRILEAKGAITRASGRARTIQMGPKMRRGRRGLPLAGRVAAGPLNEAVAQDQRIDFTSWFVRPGSFLLEVTGESMIGAHITEGDYVVIDPNRSAAKGDIVVLQTDEGEATLKYWFPERGRVRLQPANRRMKAIYVKEPHILGVVIGVIRRLRA